MTIWSVLLVQALFVGIPATLERRGSEPRRDLAAEDRFQRAHRTAESALRRLSTVR